VFIKFKDRSLVIIFCVLTESSSDSSLIEQKSGKYSSQVSIFDDTGADVARHNRPHFKNQRKLKPIPSLRSIF